VRSPCCGCRLGDLLQLRDHSFHRLVDPAFKVHRVHAGGHVLHAFLHNGLSQQRGGRGAVTGHVRGLGCHFLDHLRAHVLELVLKFDFFGDRHAILGDRWSAEGAVQHHVAALGAKRHFDRVGQNIHACDDAMAGGIVKLDVFGCHKKLLLKLK